MDTGGVALAEALPRSRTLESITISHNFIMEDAAKALLMAAASCHAALKEIRSEGNLFDES